MYKEMLDFLPAGHEKDNYRWRTSNNVSHAPVIGVYSAEKRAWAAEKGSWLILAANHVTDARFVSTAAGGQWRQWLSL